MFSGLLKASLGVISIPLALVADAVTLGGSLTDRDAPYTVQAVGDVVTNLENITKPDPS